MSMTNLKDININRAKLFVKVARLTLGELTGNDKDDAFTNPTNVDELNTHNTMVESIMLAKLRKQLKV